MNCDICTLLAHPTEEDTALLVHQGRHWRVTLRQDQEYLGTVYVTAMRHVASLPELTEAEDNEFISIRNALITAQQEAFGAHVVNVSCLMNLAFTEDGQGSPHVHYHFKPRYAQPVTFAGHEFIDRQFGRYITDKHPNEVPLATGVEIAQRLATYCKAL